MVAVQAIATGSMSISAPFLPLFIQQLGVHPLALVETWAGVVQSTAFALAAISAPIWGSLSDRTGRKVQVLRASTCGTVASILMGLSQNVWELCGTRALLGVFAGFASSSTALVASVVPGSMLGFALGWMATAQMVGTLIGPLIGGAVADVVHNYRTIYFCTAVGTAIAFFTVLFFVHENFQKKPPEEAAQAKSNRAQLREILLHPEVAPLFVVLAVAQVTTLAVQPVVPMFIQQMVGPAPYVATLAGAAFAAIGIGDLIASPFLGKRSDTLGYRRVLLISLIGAGLFTIPQGFTHNVWVFLGLRFGVGLFIGGIIPTTNAWIGRLFPRDMRGKVYGLSYSAGFVGMFCGPISGGLLAGHVGFSAVFLITGSLILLNAVWVAFGIRSDPERAWS
jgi:DHA1 family multidrug resistance protein-like MFS transporter